ncbi:hypothetical protein V2J09_003230 [Rumex salicifolius]
MGSETNSPSASSSPSAKRSRDPEDDVYVDNLHSHKRYLSEIMASSLNGLTVGDQNSEAILDSPARSESMFYLRDELSLQYSPMSEDLDDTRYCETPTHASCSSQPDSRPTSPVSPYRYKSLTAFCQSPPHINYQPSSSSCSVYPPSQSRHNQRGSDAEGRFPSSPSDICHSADLRRAALLRSVQMRVHHPGPTLFDLAFHSGQEPMHAVDQDQVEEQPCSYIKPLTDEPEDYQIDNDGCSSMGINELEYDRKNPCRDLHLDKVESSKD